MPPFAHGSAAAEVDDNGGTMARVLEGAKVLVVEDQYFLADDLQRALAAQGAEVVGPAPSEERALDLIAHHEDLAAAILDIDLRGTPVFSVADALRDRNIPFVFATGYHRSTIPEAYQEVPCWSKPFASAELVRALPKLIGR